MGAIGAETVIQRLNLAEHKAEADETNIFLIREYAAYEARHGPKENHENQEVLLRFPP
jgi:hypothetical protein